MALDPSDAGSTGGKPLRGGSAIDPLAGMFSNSSDATKTSLANQALGNLDWFNDAATKVTNEAMRSTKRVAANSVETLDGFVSSMAESTKKATQSTAESIEAMFASMPGSAGKHLKTVFDLVKSNIVQFEGLSKETEKMIDNTLSGIGLKQESLINRLTKTAAAQFVSNGSVNLGGIAKLAGEGALLAATATAMNTQNQSLDLMKSLGGNTDQMNQFIGILPQVAVGARLASTQVFALGQSFANAGIPLTSATKDLSGYMTIAGQATQLIGISNDQAAQYTKSLIAQGYTSGQVAKSFDSLYSTMQMTNQTSQDLIESMTQASTLVADFGGTAHRDIYQFTSDLLVARGMFKGLGIDAKAAGDVIGDSFKDGGAVALRRAALTANALGGSTAEYFNQQMFDPAKGASNDIQAAMTQLIRMSPTAGMGQAELTKQFGGDQNAIMQAQLNSMRNVNQLSQLYGLSPQVLQQSLANFRGSGQSSVSGWMNKREQERAATAPPVAWTQAWNNVNSTFPKLLEQFTRLGQNLLIIFGSPVVGMLTPLLQVANSFLDKLAMAVTSDNPIVKSLVSLTSVGAAIVFAFGPVMGIFRAVTGLAGAMGPALTLFRGFGMLAGGAGAIAGITEFLPVVIGGAIAVAIGAVFMSLAPGLIKSLGDGFNAVVAWLKTVNWWDVLTNKSRGGDSSTTPNDNASGAVPSAVSGGSSSAVPRGAIPVVPVSPVTGSPIGASGNINSLFEKYESGGGPGRIGDYMFHGRHNVAYGVGQLDAGMGTPAAFVKWAQASNNKSYQEFGNYLAPFVGSAMQGANGQFGANWQQAARQDPTGFKQLQEDFLKHQYLDPELKRFGSALDNPVLQAVAMSTAIQHGSGMTNYNGRGEGGANILKNAGLGIINDPEQLIRNIYAERERAFPATKARYERELVDAIKALHSTTKEQHTEAMAQKDDHHTDSKVHAERVQDTHEQLRIHRDSLNNLVPAATGTL